MILPFALLALHSARAGWKVQLQAGSVTVVRSSIRGSNFVFVEGGRPSSRLSKGRQPVTDFVRDTGAVAGINGTFFVMAAIRSNSNRMVGPVMTEETGFVPCNASTNSEKLDGRPLVAWNHESIAFAPYDPATMNREDGVVPVLPNATDCFVAGAWLVKDGEAATGKDILLHGPRDAQTPRKRSFIGTTATGRFVAGASLGSVSSAQLAQAALEAGCMQAALLDSGFSTSLVVGSRTLASGHSTSTQPSRPVPHAIVVFGHLDPSDSQ